MVCFSPCHCCISTWFLCSVCSLGQYLPTTVLQIVMLRWEEQMINTNSIYWLMCCFQALWNQFVFSYMCVTVMRDIILSHHKALHMKCVDLFRFILVKSQKIWMFSKPTSHPSFLYFHPIKGKYITCLCNEIPPDHILKKIPSYFSHLDEFILKYTLKLFILFMNKW